MVNAQEWLDKEYPKDGVCQRKEDKENCGRRREQITNLNVKGENVDEKLEGSLDLSDFEKLEDLNCGANKLKTLNLNNCLNLKTLYCFNNQLAELKIDKLTNLVHLDCRDNLLKDLRLPSSAEKLTYLTVRNNDFSERDLSMFSHLVNLETLYVDNDSLEVDNQGKFDRKHYNKFEGSLEPLKSLTKLKVLNISNTDIDSGLEHLPKSVKTFYYSADMKIGGKETRVKKIERLLKGKLPVEIENDPKKLLNRSEEIQKDIHNFFEGYSNEEVKEFKDPREVERWKNFFHQARWAERIVSATGSVISLSTDYKIVSAVIGIAYPVTDALISDLENKLVKSNESKWEAFVKSSEKLWSDYRELADNLETFEIFTDSSVKELAESVEKLEEKKAKDGIGEKDQKLLDQLKEKLGNENYRLWTAWKKFKEVYPDDLMTKDGFAQDLWEYWEWKVGKTKFKAGWSRIDGRKAQWKEIGEILTGTSPKAKSIDKKPEELKEIVVENQKQQAQIIQPAYGTFPSSSKK